jgi:hypothetical protein
LATAKKDYKNLEKKNRVSSPMALPYRKEVPTCNWDTSGWSLIDNEDVAQEIHMYLQTLGPYSLAELIVWFIDTPEMLACLNWKKTISITTHNNGFKR